MTLKEYSSQDDITDRHCFDILFPIGRNRKILESKFSWFWYTQFWISLSYRRNISIKLSGGKGYLNKKTKCWRKCKISAFYLLVLINWLAHLSVWPQMWSCKQSINPDHISQCIVIQRDNFMTNKKAYWRKPLTHLTLKFLFTRNSYMANK